jgi:hypothetical protein
MHVFQVQERLMKLSDRMPNSTKGMEMAVSAMHLVNIPGTDASEPGITGYLLPTAAEVSVLAKVSGSSGAIPPAS